MKVIVTTTREEVTAYPPLLEAIKEKVSIYDPVRKRILEVERWVANVPDVFVLADTIKEEIIIIPKIEGESYPTIEIYNDYRE